MSAKQKKKKAEKAKSKKSRESALTGYCEEGCIAVSSRARKREKKRGKRRAGRLNIQEKKKEEGRKNEPERSSCGKDQYGKTNTITYVQLFISTSANKHKKKIRRK